jgi:hypothetical protein
MGLLANAFTDFPRNRVSPRLPSHEDQPLPFQNRAVCLLLYTVCPLNCLIIIRFAREMASANALEMTISSWVDPEYPLCRAFSHSIGGQDESFG